MSQTSHNSLVDYNLQLLLSKESIEKGGGGGAAEQELIIGFIVVSVK